MCMLPSVKEKPGAVWGGSHWEQDSCRGVEHSFQGGLTGGIHKMGTFVFSSSPSVNYFSSQ